MKYSIPNYTDNLPRLSTKQMIEVDRLMIEKYNIQLIQMMENAGRCLAILAMKRFLSSKPRTNVITILAGTGNNGGGALVCGRRLANWGCEVKVCLTSSDHMKPIPKHQLDILRNMSVDISLANDLPEYANSDLIIDGIIGYSILGDPSGPAKYMIEWANKSKVPVTALDTPSGIDLTSGNIHSHR